MRPADVVRCKTCQKRTPGYMAVWNKTSWPKCCGETMELVVETERRPVFGGHAIAQAKRKASELDEAA